jgi:hypothetical protein
VPRKLDERERDEFLADVRVGVISVTAPDPDRGPLAVPIWYSFEPGEGVSVITERTSRKGQAIERANRFTLVVQQESMPYRYVSVEGPVVAARPIDDGEVEPLARRYLGTQIGIAYASSFGSDPGTYRYTMAPQRWHTYTEAD